MWHFFAYNKYNFTCTVYLSTEILNTDNSEANDVIERFHKIMKKNLKATKGKGKGKGKKGKGKNKGNDDTDSDSELSSHSDDDLNLLEENSDQEMDMKGKGKGKNKSEQPLEEKRNLIFPFEFEFKMVDDRTDDAYEWQKARPWKVVWNETKRNLKNSAKRLRIAK